MRLNKLNNELTKGYIVQNSNKLIQMVISHISFLQANITLKFQASTMSEFWMEKKECKT